MNAAKQDVVISNLPLLFSNGKPTSLESMTAEDLQYFVSFLMKCLLGCGPSEWINHPKFTWWPTGVPWTSIILSQKHKTTLWRAKFLQLVKNCYEFNQCSYLLAFSANLGSRTGGCKYTDNWDGTTSIYDKISGKLLVTLQNENMNYDRAYRQHGPRPLLLSSFKSPNTPKKAGSPGGKDEALMADPIAEIYLCDNCGTEFNSLNAIKTHEIRCLSDVALDLRSRNTDSIDSNVANEQAKFMSCFSLVCRNRAGRPPKTSPLSISPSLKEACTLNDKRFTTIPFSSNLGKTLGVSKQHTRADSESLVSRYERSCLTRPFGNAKHGGKFKHNAAVSRTPSLCVSKKKEDSTWSHSYCFNKADKRERMLTINSGLNKRARRLLISCKSVRLTLNRLSLSLTSPKPIQTVFQPSIQKHIARLSSDVTISLVPFAPTFSASVPVDCHKISNYLTNRKETFDYCSVADEVENIYEEKSVVGAKLCRPSFSLPPTVTISEAKSQTEGKSQKTGLIPFSSQNGIVHVHRNGHHQIVPSEVTKSTIRNPAALKSNDDLQNYLGEKKHVNLIPSLSLTSYPVCSVVPLNLGSFKGKLPVEKRKQMKQSLGIGTSTQVHPIELAVPHPDRENRDEVTSKRRASGRGNLEILKLRNDECKELKRMGLEDILLSNQRVTRCRTKSHSVSNFSEPSHHFN